MLSFLNQLYFRIPFSPFRFQFSPFPFHLSLFRFQFSPFTFQFPAFSFHLSVFRFPFSVFRYNFVAKSLRALGVEGVAGTEGDNLALDTATHQRHVTYDIQQFVAGGLVGIVERTEVAQLTGI